ncbi:PREDICTED: EGF-containing fibulin-like extracellular matrix protein 1 [Acropora digitifera]|uniref:EGF-containing fibulin-like extracellular matrix protein 1 n=1 Tax=Acropora digitifera TaxID=70779 RepID=UPI00077A6DFC|nr:PREDICTED: EGF-containing fibulin-like extracellular matrix protein 1 [Acropora digitifera]
MQSYMTLKLFFVCAALLEVQRLVKATNECAQGRHNCHQNARCIDLQEGYDCKCSSGFTGDGISDCTDVDECVAGDICSGYRCTYTKGSYTCECQAGYKWNSNSMSCKDVNECSLNTDNCSNLATCTNTKGSYRCNCISGYTGNGVTCADLDECSTGVHSCKSGQICVNEVGTFSCNCGSGLKWNSQSKTCKDIDECALNTHNCSSMAICSNNHGSFSCTCTGGYTGNGFTCTETCSYNGKSNTTHAPLDKLLERIITAVVLSINR